MPCSSLITSDCTCQGELQKAVMSGQVISEHPAHSLGPRLCCALSCLEAAVAQQLFLPSIPALIQNIWLWHYTQIPKQVSQRKWGDGRKCELNRFIPLADLSPGFTWRNNICRDKTCCGYGEESLAKERSTLETRNNDQREKPNRGITVLSLPATHRLMLRQHLLDGDTTRTSEMPHGQRQEDFFPFFSFCSKVRVSGGTEQINEDKWSC